MRNKNVRDFFKILFACFIAMLVIFALCVMAKADTAYVLCKPNDFVNVRMTPSSNGTIVGRYDCGESFETDGVVKKDKKNRKWLHVVDASFEVDEAWVCLSYVQYSPICIEDANATVVTKGRTAIRNYPNGKVNKWVNNGADVKIFAHSDEWALTSRGYISMDCIEVWYGNAE